MERKFCINCGAERALGAAFCQSCGTRFDGVAPPATSPVIPDSVIPDPTIPRPGDPVVPTAEGHGSRCSNCGRPTQAGLDRCAECGPTSDTAVARPPVGRVIPPLPGNITPTASPAPTGPRPPIPPAPAMAAHAVQAGQANVGPKPGPPPWVWLVGGLGVLGVVGLIIALVVGGASGHTLTGTITVYDYSSTGCDLSVGYSDMREGARVIVTDASDKVIASSYLDEGGGDYLCEFPFTVKDVPDRDEYWIEIGNRGELHYDKSELEDMDWKLELTLGGD